MLTSLSRRPDRPIRLQGMLRPEQNSFAVVRLIAAFAVVVSHCYLLQSGSSENEPLYTSTGYSLGAYGVQVFFVLSGILVAQSLMRSTSLLDFAIARTLRIFPALIVCVLLISFLLGPALSSLGIADYFRNDVLYAYLGKTLFLTTGSAPLPRLFSANPVPNVVNLSLWTLKYEVLCYASLAAVGGLLLGYGSRSTRTAAAFAAWVGIMILFPPGLGQGNSGIANAHFFFLFFGVGVTAYLGRRLIPVTTSVLGVLFMFFFATVGTKWASIGAVFFLGYAAIYAASFDLGLLRRLTNRYDLSYGTYIYGVPVTQALLVVEPTLGVWPLIALTTVIVLLLAFLSWVLIERPALALRTRIATLLDGLQGSPRLSCSDADARQASRERPAIRRRRLEQAG